MKQNNTEQAKQHCWECRRRRLVCDFTQPGCTRCATTGVTCPGYGPSQPVSLRWLPPGKVKSRNTKHKQKQVDRTEKEQSKIPVNAEHVVIQSPCAEITTLAHMLVEAADYFNSHIGPSIKPMLDITPKFGVPVISPIIFQHGLGYPDHTRLVLACTSLGHRMCLNADQWNALNHKFLYCRGLIINSLRDEINSEDKKTSNFLVAGILTLVLVDVRQGMSHTSWRYHLNAIRKIINLRGGFRSFSESPGAIPLLHSFMVFEVLGDTSSPVSDLAVNEDQIDELYSMMDEYAEEMDLFRIIPAPLFIAIIKINHLRSRAADLSLRDGQTSEAYEILYAILIFLPEDWALSKSKTQESDFTTIAIAYKAAVTLYCISSLQSVAVLPATHYLTNIEISMTRMLKQTLSKALCSAKFMRLLLWPLVVLGALALGENWPMQDFVRCNLLAISEYTGIYTPQTATKVLERFWASGESSWDSCFHEPYMFWSLQGIESRTLWKAKRR